MDTESTPQGSFAFTSTVVLIEGRNSMRLYYAPIDCLLIGCTPHLVSSNRNSAGGLIGGPVETELQRIGLLVFESAVELKDGGTEGKRASVAKDIQGCQCRKKSQWTGNMMPLN